MHTNCEGRNVFGLHVSIWHMWGRFQTVTNRAPRAGDWPPNIPDLQSAVTNYGDSWLTSDLFGSEWSGSEGKSTSFTEITI
jgi:hypothetical protein